MLALNNIYPIFEADQVLSQTHLNKLVSYLEEQDRISRTCLLGMGIVCGLEIKKPTNVTIQISCGTGITSLGFLITVEESEYTHYKESTISDLFLNPDLTSQEYLGEIYKYSSIYEPLKNCFELVNTDSEEDKIPLSDTFIEDKIVMLLLEVSLIDQKNCDTTDCADKGKRLEFKIRPLLVSQELLEENKEIITNSCIRDYFKPIVPAKYNVPRTNLVTGSQVLQQFNKLIDNDKEKISQVLNTVHDHYKPAFDSLPDYGSLQNTINKLNAVHDQNKEGIYIQYVWDWISDIAATYDEIAAFNTCNPTLCCPDKGIFPFHLLLGSAQFATAHIPPGSELHTFRTTFIKTGVLAENERELKLELKGLLAKLIHQVNHFDLNFKILNANKGQIKITPSVLGRYPLSQKAIPFYYDKIDLLVKKWSPEKTLKNWYNQTLSYHSGIYNNSDDHVKNPLKYDTEPFNFYRIEGHIGQNYKSALRDILHKKNVNRLPFKVVALNALNFSKRAIDISKHKGDWGDMELDYDLARIRFKNIIKHIIEWSIKANEAKLKDIPNATSLINFFDPYRNLFPDDLQDFLLDFKDIYPITQGLKRIIMFYRFFILKREGDLSEGLEDLIDHLDEIKNLLTENPFAVIYKEAMLRWRRYSREMFLSRFLEKHPGINHKAGVPKGGTFILIYKDSSVFIKRSINPSHFGLFLNAIETSSIAFNFTTAEVATINTEIATIDKPIINLDIIDKDDACNDAVNRAIGELRERVKDFPFDIRDLLFGDFEPEPDKTIPENVVLADFYLPYLCCSQGNNINIVLPSTPDQIAVADFDGRDFNIDDFFTNR